MTDTISTSAEALENSAIPRCHEVHRDTETVTIPNIPEELAQTPVTRKSAAQWAYERLILYIRNFEDSLDNQHEIALGLTGSNAGVLRIEGMGYFDPDIVTFYGIDADGAKTQLIQHVSQLSVILRVLPKPADEPEPRRIGFRLVADLEKP